MRNTHTPHCIGCQVEEKRSFEDLHGVFVVLFVFCLQKIPLRLSFTCFKGVQRTQLGIA